MSELAIYGGKPAVPAGAIKPWPYIGKEEEDMVLRALRSGVHNFGPECRALQDEFAEWNGNKYCITTNSGTAALHMGLVACGVGAGDHVLVSAYTWSASATCILHHCAVPIFADIDFDTVNMDVDKIESAITPRTKAIIAIHLHGLSLDMDKLMAIARKHNIKVLEDACQSVGALYKGRKVGTLGDCAAFSLAHNKSLCSGEGGLFVTDDPAMHDKAKQVWSFGETKIPGEDRDYHAYMIGWMYRNNDIIAAFGRSQLKKLEDNLKVQRENALNFHEQIKHLAPKGLILPFEPEGEYHHTWYEYVIRLDMDKIGWQGDPGVFRDAVNKALMKEGLRTAIWQRMILPEMTVFKHRNAYGLGVPWSIDNAGEGVEYNAEDYPNAVKHSRTHIGINMPLRAPNGPETVKLLAEAYSKVLDNLDKIDPERISKIK